MPEDRDENVVMCPRVGSEYAAPVSGARIGDCSKCKAPVWCSPTTAASGYTVMCMECGCERIAALKAAGEDIEAGILPGQPEECLREMRRILGDY